MKVSFRKIIVGLTFALAFALSGAMNTSALQLENEQDLVVKNYLNNSSTTIKARFGGGTPFVKLDSLYSLMSDNNITISTLEPGVYEVITAGGRATINTLNDSLYSANYSEFIAMPSDDESDDEPDSNNGMPKMIKGMNYQIKGDASATTIDFTKYNVDLYGEDNSIWMPATTVFNIFMQMGFYDGDTLNILNNRDTDISSTAEYKSKLQNLFSNKQRFSEYSKQAYDGLCLMFDVFYGYPEKSLLSSSIKSNGLDSTLKNYNDETRLIRTWLLSDNLVEYYAGLVGLDAALYDGGHTNLTDIFMFDYLLEAYPGLANSESYELYKNLEFYKNKPVNTWIRMMDIAKARNEHFGSEKYTEKGDTAIYSFDGFDFDVLGWDYYYENGGGYPNDTLGNILKYLDKASENPDIKYFIFDISNNTGGLALVAPMIMNYLGYDNILHEKNTITNQVEEIGFEIDTNRDGIYDDNDRISKYHFNYAVLISEFTFSTGNLFAAMAEDNGFAILGERSGGGACNLTAYNTSEGVIYYMSALSCSLNKQGASVDLGVQPNYDLIEIVDGKKVYNKFYELDTLSGLLNEFYRKDEQDAETIVDDGSDSTNTGNNAGANTKLNSKRGRKIHQASTHDVLSSVDEDSGKDTEQKEGQKHILDESREGASKDTKNTEVVETDEKAAEETHDNNLTLYILAAGLGVAGVIGIVFYIIKRKTR